MEIASGVFWIMFGLLYVLYKCLKEEPEATIQGIIICAIGISYLAGFFFTFDWLVNVNIPIAAVFAVAAIGTPLAFYIRSCIKEEERRKKLIEAHHKASKMVEKEVYTTEELAKYAEVWLKTSPNRWKYDLPNGQEICRELIEHDYRSKVRYPEIYKQLTDGIRNE